MKQQDRKPEQTHHRPTRLGAVAAALLCLGLLAASPAPAAYEQVDTFAGTPGVLKLDTGLVDEERSKLWPEEVQLASVSGMAVNVTGAGGVPAGTVYAATYFSQGGEVRVARFNPDGSFSENWTFTEGLLKERCGPDGDPAHPVCQSRPRGNVQPIDVEVDQTTGYVYVLGNLSNPGTNLIHVYSPDGSKLITEFGVKAAVGETTAASPEKIHGSSEGGIAVGPAGKVYVFDNNSKEKYHRLMVFEPQSPGDYEHYVYAGQGKDVAAGFNAETVFAAMPVADSAGDLYVSSFDANFIAKLDPSQPSAPPLCQFSLPQQGINSITVNPESGEVFFFSYKDRKVHQLKPCDEGKFAEAGAFGFVPQRKNITAMAFDPARQFEPSRPTGTLYAGAPSGEGGNSEGEIPNFKAESSLGYIFALPAEFPPEVKAESVAHVTATTAELRAQINPKGPQTDFVFQYITQAEYEANEPADRFAGAAEAPPGGGFLGEGPAALSAATSLSGLEPDTTYHYRAVATSHCSVELPEKVCQGVGADQSFHTFPVEAPGLPDERVYELVSPAQKGSGQVLPAAPAISSCSGEECKPGNLYIGFPRQSTPDGEAIVYEGSPFSDAGALRENQYIARRDSNMGWQTTSLAPKLLAAKAGYYAAFDTALSLGMLAQADPVLSPEAPSGFSNLYSQPTANPLAISPLLLTEPPHRLADEFTLGYAGASADLSRVFFTANDALTEATPFAPEAQDGGATKKNLYEWERATGQLRLVNVMPGNTETKAGASLGPDSAHTISADGSRAFFSDESGQVYVRENAEVTRAIPDPGKFLSAATDGSKVLLDDGHIYDLETEASTDLTQGKGGFEGIAGQSDDLSHVYFVDTAVLDEVPNAEGDAAEAGKHNLYAWSGASPRFVATLVTADNSGVGGIGSAWSSSPAARRGGASPAGRYLAFLSRAPITGYDNVGPCEIDQKGGFFTLPCPEVFLYDSVSDELICPSCNPSGERPLGHSVLSAGLAQSRYPTDEGRLYFDSQDALVPADTNEGVEDVYQYEPNEVGTCKRAAGCVNLISAGREPIDSNFLAMDATGKSVFFTSRDQLVLRDHDDLIDLYVAREGGGIPAETEVARSECQGEACVPALAPPNDPTPGSSSFEGAGNVDEKKATKKHRKKKKHAKKKHAHKRAAKHNRGGAK